MAAAYVFAEIIIPTSLELLRNAIKASVQKEIHLGVEATCSIFGLDADAEDLTSKIDSFFFQDSSTTQREKIQNYFDGVFDEIGTKLLQLQDNFKITDKAVHVPFLEFLKAVSAVQFHLNSLILHPDETYCQKEFCEAYSKHDPPGWVNYMHKSLTDAAEDGLLIKLETVVGNDFGKLEKYKSGLELACEHVYFQQEVHFITFQVHGRDSIRDANDQAARGFDEAKETRRDVLKTQTQGIRECLEQTIAAVRNRVFTQIFETDE
ncbi:hypothetical protein BV898_18544 [Hypsibius exemplaris]|uniref:Uncharacterized protein n=1 Tax=Hypsibius exemplaris TaxID=2072580 RepID=A0A9X6RNY6_HYPEX|nr:hypothetical protein BV898_18544 [Hypsibius exemplaris]